MPYLTALFEGWLHAEARQTLTIGVTGWYGSIISAPAGSESIPDPLIPPDIRSDPDHCTASNDISDTVCEDTLMNGLIDSQLKWVDDECLVWGWIWRCCMVTQRVSRSGLRGGRAGPPPRAPRFGGPAPWHLGAGPRKQKMEKCGIIQFHDYERWKLSMKFTNVRVTEWDTQRQNFTEMKILISKWP